VTVFANKALMIFGMNNIRNLKKKRKGKQNMMKPLALDLCCGKGGWTKGLLAAGWDVIGVDIKAWEGYPKEADFWLCDVKELHRHILLERQGRKISLVVASPPCQEFSYRSFPFKRCRELAANVPPDKSIWQACERIAKECNAPLVLENVRGAEKYMGKANAHYGSFYLWGDVPALLPIGCPRKGFVKSKDGKNGMQRIFGEMRNGQNKKEFAANAAIIPFELAYWVGEVYKPK
jgi:site-specific DNA-cytosine methylase